MTVVGFIQQVGFSVNGEGGDGGKMQGIIVRVQSRTSSVARLEPPQEVRSKESLKGLAGCVAAYDTNTHVHTFDCAFVARKPRTW